MLPSIRTCAAAEPVSGALTSRRAVDDGWNRSGGVVRSAPDRRPRTASTAGPAATNRPSMLGTRPESINSRTSRTSTPAAVAISAALNTSSRCETSGMRTLLRAKALPCRRVPARRIGPGLRPILSSLLPSRIAGLCSSADSGRTEGTLFLTRAGTRDSGLGDRGAGRLQRRCDGLGPARNRASRRASAGWPDPECREARVTRTGSGTGDRGLVTGSR